MFIYLISKIINPNKLKFHTPMKVGILWFNVYLTPTPLGVYIVFFIIHYFYLILFQRRLHPTGW